MSFLFEYRKDNVVRQTKFNKKKLVICSNANNEHFIRELNS